MTAWHCALVSLIIALITVSLGFEEVTDDDLVSLRAEVREMFQHSYDGYLRHAYPLDELRPLTCDGQDTWGSYSLTLLDALDTLAVMGNFSEFRRVADLIVTSHSNMDHNINVSVFETNIRVLGGLLSAHLMLDIASAELPRGWPCEGPLLALAVDVANRLLPAFDTPTGMPYGTVNLRHGVPSEETPITCTAGVGTFLIEFGALSRLTGDPQYERTALRAVYALWERRSSLGLLGNHINVLNGKWTATDAGIGAGVDSLFEYLVKASQLLRRPELMAMFTEARAAIDAHLRHDDWYMWVSMSRGQVTLPVFQSLEAFWPGVLSLVGDNRAAMRSLHNYYSVWRQYGFTPEFYSIPRSEAVDNRAGYPLRPELVESLVYLHRSTGSRQLLAMGRQLLQSIQHSTRTRCGYATVKNVKTHQLDNRMESFFLAETTKYLYLLFDPSNLLHNSGDRGRLVRSSRGPCLLHAGGYVFNTEAHPIDPGALECCSGPSLDDVVSRLRRDVKHRSRGKRASVRGNPSGRSDHRASSPTGAVASSGSAACLRSSPPEFTQTVSAGSCAAYSTGGQPPDGPCRDVENQYGRLTCERPSLQQRLMFGFEVFGT